MSPTVSAPPTSTPAAASEGGTNTARASACRRGDPLANVYHPYRLRVVDACKTVSGQVMSVRSEDDGDIHFDIALDSRYQSLLTQQNVSAQHGWLVAEIVPADEPGCTPGQPPVLPPSAYRSAGYSYGVCTGADESAPSVGAHVSITGPYVIDNDHGAWAEIHPVWAMTGSTGSTGSVGEGPSATPSQTTESGQAHLAPPGSQPSAASGPQAAGAAWCAVTASQSNDGYAGDYEVYVHSNQPDQRATASDAGDMWSKDTDSAGYADIRLYHTSPGEPISVTVGSASCSTTA